MAKFATNDPKFVCLKHIEGYKPGAVVSRNQLPATADMEFLASNGAIREASPEEAAKEAVDINPKSVSEAASNKINELMRQNHLLTSRLEQSDRENQVNKMAVRPINDLEKLVTEKDGTIAALRSEVAQLKAEVQKGKDAAAVAANTKPKE